VPRTFDISGQGVTILIDTITDVGNVYIQDVMEQNTYSLDFSQPKNSFYLSINSI
jgi:hypothetical protein